MSVDRLSHLCASPSRRAPWRTFLLLSQLLRAPAGSRLVRSDFDGTTLTLGIATTNPNASCPACGLETWRVHSRYTRSLAEEPIFGHQVRLLMTVRRFFCSGSRMPASHLRRTARRLRGQACSHDRPTRPDPPRHRLGPGRRGRGQAGGEARRADQPRYAAATRQAGGGSAAGEPAARRHRRLGLVQGATLRHHRRRPRDRRGHRSPARPRRRHRRAPGSRPIPASNWSAATARRPTPRRPPRRRPRPSRSPIDGTC